MLIIIFLIINISCNHTTTNTLSHYSSVYLYESAQKKLHQKNYKGAIQDLIQLQNLHLFNPCAQYIHLNLIYAYYKSNNLKLVTDSIQKFLNLYPKHKNLDYVLYMHGITNMYLDKKFSIPIITKLFNLNSNNYNPIYAQTAFYSLKQLIQKYPNSQYSTDAYLRLIFLKNRIANYELSIIEFYSKKKEYPSVITRTKKMLCYFPDTQATRKALYYMQQAYLNMQLPEQAKKIAQIIINNPI